MCAALETCARRRRQIGGTSSANSTKVPLVRISSSSFQRRSLFQGPRSCGIDLLAPTDFLIPANLFFKLKVPNSRPLPLHARSFSGSGNCKFRQIMSFAVYVVTTGTLNENSRFFCLCPLAWSILRRWTASSSCQQRRPAAFFLAGKGLHTMQQ